MIKCVAVIGLGNISTRHRQNLRQLYPDALIIAMSASGRIPEQPISDADKIVVDMSALISEVPDFVVVASPASFHADHAIPLLESHIPVLVEKPVTHNEQHLLRLVHAASESDTLCSVAYCLRFLPCLKMLKKMLESAEFGNVYNAHIEVGQYLPDWRNGTDYRCSVSGSKKLGGGALLELSHELDYANWLFGDLSLMYSELRATDELDIAVEQVVDLFLKSDSNVTVVAHLDFIQKQATRKCIVITEKCRIECDLIANSITVRNGIGDEVIYSEPSWNKNGMYLEMLSRFVESMQGSETEMVSIAEAGKTVKLIDKIKSYHHEFK
ncbi:MAG: Gfo/Idh/MocA family protein [Aestuariibacter sp.]